MESIEVKDDVIKRLRVLFKQLMKDSSFIPGPLQSMVTSLVEGYLNRAKITDVETIIRQIRDEVIPWLLGEVPSDNH